MPYVTQKQRDQLAQGAPPADAGELNYSLTMTVLNNTDPAMLGHDLRAICDRYIAHKGLRYAYINDVGGALLWASCEYVRRTGDGKFVPLFAEVSGRFYKEVAAPYEDTKIAENGDCYPVRG